MIIQKKQCYTLLDPVCDPKYLLIVLILITPLEITFRKSAPVKNCWVTDDGFHHSQIAGGAQHEARGLVGSSTPPFWRPFVNIPTDHGLDGSGIRKLQWYPSGRGVNQRDSRTTLIPEPRCHGYASQPLMPYLSLEGGLLGASPCRKEQGGLYQH